jgi:hypothetical protein
LDSQGRTGHAVAGIPLLTAPGKPAAQWHALLAGWIGGLMIWAKHSSVNEQIVMYLFSRILVGLCKLFAKKGVSPFNKWTFGEFYPYFAAGYRSVSPHAPCRSNPQLCCNCLVS